MKTKQEMIFEAAVQFINNSNTASIKDCVNNAFAIYNAVEERIKKEQNDKIRK